MKKLFIPLLVLLVSCNANQLLNQQEFRVGVCQDGAIRVYNVLGVTKDGFNGNSAYATNQLYPQGYCEMYYAILSDNGGNRFVFEIKEQHRHTITTYLKSGFSYEIILVK